MDIAAVSEVPGGQGGSYERHPQSFIGICNIISRKSLLGGFLVR